MMNNLHARLPAPNVGLTVALIMFAVCSFIATPVRAQEGFTATLAGTVQDASQATVPGATVTITNDSTKVAIKRTTDNAGRYIFTGLQPAGYTMTVEAKGFKMLVRSNVVLRVSQATSLDFTLEVGAVSTKVEVKGAAPLLNTLNAAMGQEVDNQYMREMPLQIRAMMKLVFLAPGIVENQEASPYGNSQLNFMSNGQRNSTAQVTLDGAQISAPEGGEGAQSWQYIQPSPEMIQEFKLINNGMSAEYGNNGGTVINMVSVSGSNKFHGTGYEFAQRPAWNSGTFFGNRAGNKKPAGFVRDQYGGAIGGPIVKNKTFFFFDYDRMRYHAPSTTTLTVPTAAQREGDFSQTFNSNGTLDQIYNPYNGSLNASGHWIRAPFSGNIIPTNLLDQTALKMATYYPPPTSAGAPLTGINNYTISTTGPQHRLQYTVKIDHNFSERSHLSARFTEANSDNSTPNFYNTIADTNHYLSSNRVRNGVFQETYTINPNTILTGRVAVDKVHLTAYPSFFDGTAIGLSPYFGNQVLPSFTISGFGGLGTPTSTSEGDAHTDPNFAASLVKLRGAHTLKVGGEQRIQLENFCTPCFPVGGISFSTGVTVQDPVVNNPLQGNGMASFLLGWPGSGSQIIHPGPADRSTETAFYIQDDWRVSTRLTMNLGLRYEVSTPFTERHNRTQYFDANASSGIIVPGYGMLKGEIKFTDALNRRAKRDWNNLAPRLGLAYRFSQNTVLRLGGGVYYGMNPATNFYVVGPAWTGSSTIIGSQDSGHTQYASLENPYPAGLNATQGRTYGDLNMWGVGGLANYDMYFRNPEIYQWNGTLQHQLPGNALVEVAYSASRSTHLPDNGVANLNYLTDAQEQQYGTQALATQVPNPFQYLFNGPNAIFNVPGSILNNATITRAQTLLPYPQFAGGGVGGRNPAQGNAKYQSLQFRVEQRLSHGLFFFGSYTYSRAMDDSTGSNTWLTGTTYLGPQDMNNTAADFSLSPADAPHRVVGSFGYALPVGRGRRLGSNMSRGLNAAIGGWEFKGILILSSGEPLPIYMASGHLLSGGQRPNVSGKVTAGASIQQTVDAQTPIRFNSSVFSAPADEMPGNEPRYEGSVRGDGQHNLDATIFKRFPIREHMEVQVRAEFFNFTNSPRFGQPNTAFGSSSFGAISNQVNTPRQTQGVIYFVF